MKYILFVSKDLYTKNFQVIDCLIDLMYTTSFTDTITWLFILLFWGLIIMCANREISAE